MENNINFYKKTSLYTDLGLYKNVANLLPNSIEELCYLVRNQTVHPFDIKDEKERKNKNSFYGDMTKIGPTSWVYENDLFPTAIAMMSELLRRNPEFSVQRDIRDKIHICCREVSILFTSILKAKGIAARCRSGFSRFLTTDSAAGDHWITEYYSDNEKRWVLVDCDMCFDQQTLNYYDIDFNLFDVPRDRFIFGAEAYLGLRNNVFKNKEIYYSSDPLTYGLEAAIRGLFYDFHSLMGDEIPFSYQPKYLVDNNFRLSEEEYKELDSLAKLMLNPDLNFEKLRRIWESNFKYRIMSGGMNS